MDESEVFNQYRSLLFSIAYRILGSVADAEDRVQEAFLRWHTGGSQSAESPRAYLSTVITRLCIDHLRSAKVQREVYIGPWLPEPLLNNQDNPAQHLEQAESLSYAFMVLLESLNPVERAVFVLREVFDYDYSQIAAIVDKSEANCRQIVHRAQQRLEKRQPRYQASHQQQEHLTHQFLKACASGDMQGLLNLFSQEIVIYGDGGGKAVAARQPVAGASNVARFILGLLNKFGSGYELKPILIDSSPAFATYYQGRLDGVICFMLSQDRIEEIYSLRNPDKLPGVNNLTGE